MSFQALALITALFFFPQDKLEITEVKVGDGRAVQAKDIVAVEYTGTLTTGKEFDTSRGKAPLVFTVGAEEVIKGFDQGVVGMKVGGERDLVVPPSLGYGTQTNGDIPGGSTLKFRIKLLRIDREGDKAEVERTVLKPGTGDAAVAGDLVDIHYLGTFLNGGKFDSSYDRNAPLHVFVGKERLIKGFIQGVAGIKEGEKRKFVVPASLGYGPNPRGQIPGNSTLTFEVEAVKITKKKALEEQIAADRKKLTIVEQAPGEGAAVNFGDVIQVHFVGTLSDGKSVVSTRQQNQPFTYQVGSGQLVRGFDVALAGMKAGGKCKVTIPAELGFGAKGNPTGTVPPNSTLIFEIELVKIYP